MSGITDLSQMSSAAVLGCGRAARRLLLFPSPALPRAPSHSVVRCRCVLANAIASAAVNGSSGPHAAVGSAIAQVAVTAVAIASGACLSTKVDFLWPQVEQEPDSLIFEGVDVTGYPIFKEAKVQKAIDFASKAHFDQFRKTGEPYVTHCIHTGKILAALVPPMGERAVNTVVAGILHDVIDDTVENLNSIQEVFGDDVAHLVAGVSKLSFRNQLLRRNRRRTINRSTISPQEANNLRVMLLGMVDDPRVVLVKLADRLHNMRTIYVLSLPKAQAVAEETLAVWCSLASRLGVWALKAELEDLCFAVLQPYTFQYLKAELASMWSPQNKGRNLRRPTSKSKFVAELPKATSRDSEQHWFASTAKDSENLRFLLQAVLPFDLLLDRRKRAAFVSNLNKSSRMEEMKPKVVDDASIALASMTICEEALEKELLISTSYIPGMEVTLSSRLKSLYSIYCKMRRKDVGIQQIYDARALRVVVGDKNGSLHGLAVKNCYNLLDIVHRLWTPIDGEFDDYIINPKPSGYQSLHTAVQGPDSSPLEVQIRTQRMHMHAENGLAAHWLYKESKVEPQKSVYVSKIVEDSYQSTPAEDEGWLEDDRNYRYAFIKVGHPVLRIDRSQLLTAVIVRVDKGGKELLVAVSFDFEATEEVADRRSSSKKDHWGAYARLYKKVSEQWWFAPGHGDWCTCLEKYTLCRDGRFHKEDQFGRLLPTFIQVIELTEQEETGYWMVLSSVLEGKEIHSSDSDLNYSDKTSFIRSITVEDRTHNKVQLLRTMLKWEEQVRHGAPLGTRVRGSSLFHRSSSVDLGEVAIIRWPHGEILRMRSGSTAADAAQRIGFEGKVVLVNGQHALPQTELKDGDILEVRM